MKQFKDYDGVFTAQQLDAERKKFKAFDDVSGIKYWAHGYVQPDQGDVQYAVYKAVDAARWQLFRVALKGLSTRQKLRMMYVRWEMFDCDCVDYGMVRGKIYDADISAVEWVRLNNYIGALRRGGQLNERLEVVR
jgi:hypothetical protein